MTYVELDQSATPYSDTSTDAAELHGWSYFELGHWYVPKATWNPGQCTIKAADDWAADANAETTDKLDSAWNYRVQPTCAMIRDFPTVGKCDANSNC